MTEEKEEEVKPLRLDIACGKNKQPGFIGIDKVAMDGVDVVFDLDAFPWPYESNSVDEVFCSHYIEHTKDLVAFMNELHRILKPGAKASIIAPYYNSMRCWQDPYHLRAISEATFLYFDQNWLKDQKLDHYPITANFNFTYGYAFNGNWASRSEDARNFALAHYTNVVSDIYVNLVKKE